MTIEQQAREAALISTPIGSRAREGNDEFSRDDMRDEFEAGFIAAAEPREREIAELRARVAELEGMAPVETKKISDAIYACYYKEIAVLKAKLAAVPVEEINLAEVWLRRALMPSYSEAAATIRRWLAGLR